MARKRKKIKGIGYIANVLRKYKPNSFKNQKSALEKAREIKKELKGESITIKKVLSFVVKKRVGKLYKQVNKPICNNWQFNLGY